MMFKSWMVWSMVGRGGRYAIVCLFSSVILWSSMECAYCVAIVLICLNVLLFFFVMESFSLDSKLFSDRICEMALVPKVRL